MFLGQHLIDIITVKAAKRLNLLRQLKKADVGICDLVQFYSSVIRSLLEYECQVFHHSIPGYLSDSIKRIQRLGIIFPGCKYRNALARANIPTLYDRRSTLCTQFFNNISNNVNHKLAGLLPPKAVQQRELRSNRKFSNPPCKTNRFKNSFILSHCN